MPDPEEVVVDNPVDDEAHDPTVTDGDTSPAENVPAKETLIPDKFKNVEEMVKSYTELEKEKGRLAAELGQSRAEREQLQQQIELKSVLKTLADNTAPKEKEPEPVDFEKFTETVAEKWQDNPKEAIQKILAISGQWVSQSDRKHKSELDETRKSFDERLAKALEAIERFDPEYQQNKELIDSLTALDIPLAKAKLVAKKIAASSTTEPSTSTRTLPPTTVSPTRTTVREKETPSKLLFSEKEDLEILRMDNPDLDEKQLKAKAEEMNAARLDRIKKGQPIRTGVYERRGV